MANVLKMATVADIVTLIKSGHSDRRISAVLSLDRRTTAVTGRREMVSISNPPTSPFRFTALFGDLLYGG